MLSTLSGGNLTITGASTFTNAIALSSAATITNANAVTLSGTISGTSTLTKAGAGTLTLTGGSNKNSAWGMTITAGTLLVNVGGLRRTGSITCRAAAPSPARPATTPSATPSPWGRAAARSMSAAASVRS